MGWYLNALVRDRRFRIAVAVAIGSVVAILAAVLTGAGWAMKVAQFFFFPVLALSVVAMFVVLGIIIRNDYLERKGVEDRD